MWIVVKIIQIFITPEKKNIENMPNKKIKTNQSNEEESGRINSKINKK